MTTQHILPTGQTACYSENGELVDCRNTAQDAAQLLPGYCAGWSADRYQVLNDHLVLDRATELIWMRDGCPSQYPLSWSEALQFVAQLNNEARYGRDDWRLPNRRELRSLIDHSRRKPALPAGHPFLNIFLGWYWTSTTAAIAPRYAWYLHLEGGRMFYGNKDGYYWFWPVCGKSAILAGTGAIHCYDTGGSQIPCAKSGQDAADKQGAVWPSPRFMKENDDVIIDRLTGLSWQTTALHGEPRTSWQAALNAVIGLAETTGAAWRMPTINELESLVDASAHSPALIENHPFLELQSAYWSSTTSGFEPDWAYVLYLEKGAVGVGYKKNRDFALWPVKSSAALPQVSADPAENQQRRG